MSVAHLPQRKALFLALLAATTQAGVTDLSSVPLSTYTATSSVDVKPNILLVLDDSGSMSWDYMPDWANDSIDNYDSRPEYLTKNSAYNGIAYNPAITYSPPVAFNADGTKNTTLYPSMTGAGTSSGADSTTKPNWKAVPNDGYGVQSTSTSNLVDNAYFYTIVPGEYCDSPSLRNCTTTASPSGNYAYPAYLRWCSGTTLTTCLAAWDGTNYKYPRTPAPRIATITFSSASNAVVSSIKVDGYEILSGSTGSTSTSSTVASSVSTNINNCTKKISSSCTIVGYSATVSGSTVTIYAPGSTSSTPVLTKSGSLTSTISAFARSTVPLPYYLNSNSSASTSAVPGENLRTIITSSVTSYPYPGSSTKAASRTDCAGTTCTYAEEMTNYANWWAYYRTRMQMMKTASSRAFSTIDTAADQTDGVSRFRVGYMSINNNNNDFVNLGEFVSSQKKTWFDKLFAAKPNSSTPLRAALSTAGRLYAGVLNGTTLNGTTVTDPMQWSCQQNYTILSTDGFWNNGAGYKLDGSTAVGNQDGLMARPYNDGATTTIQTRTSQLQKRTAQMTAQAGILQKQTSQLQKRTGTLQTRTRSCFLGICGSWGSWSNTTSSCTISSTRDCRYNWGTWSGTQSCTANYSSGSTYSIITGTDCQTAVTSAYANASACTPTTTPDSSGYTTQCQYNWQSSAAVSSCSPAYVAGNYSNATVYTNCNNAGSTTAWTDVSSCTATTTPNASGQTTQCQYGSWTSWANVASCTAVDQSAGPNYTVGVARQCQGVASGGTSDNLADVAAYYYNTDLRNASATSPDATGTCTGPIISPNTTANDLCTDNVPTYGRDTSSKQHMTTFTLGLGAQGRMIYSPYQNNAAGTRTYYADYWNQPSGDFYDVANGTVPNTTSGICSWMSTGTCTWPTPSSDSIANIDDLWHAAINGRGTYFSATDPQSLASALTDTLRQISNTPRPGTAAAAASSNPNVSSSDNYVFSSSYRSVEWWGELIRQQIDASDGTLSDQQWSAMQLLDCATTAWIASHTYAIGDVYKQNGYCYKVTAAYTSGASFAGGTGGLDAQNTAQLSSTPVTRKIYTSGSSGLVEFTWENLTSTQKAYFTTPAITYVSDTQGLTQFCSVGSKCLNSTSQTSASGQNLVNFLRGERTYEGSYYRSRAHILGDIVSSEARYVKKPSFDYVDSGYSDFKTKNATRSGTVYIGSNDGMLHAFNAETGQETWAFVPTAVLPNLYKLADVDYSTKHQFFVDATPEVGDVCPTAPTTACTKDQWRTILIGGLNNGGKAYYALDITDPASPSLLWEFTDTNLGYTYGNPRITKLKNGTWVVMFASGYNNADGVGRLYVLNAYTGAKMTSISTSGAISTGVGAAAAPSGLARISAHAPTPMTNNTTYAVYGGDLLGNLWRFDINNDIGTAGYDAQLLVSFADANGKAQPITDKPVVGTINSFPIIYVGTGRYLGVTDVADDSTQSIYAVKDSLGSTTLGNPRSNVAADATKAGFIKQTITSTTCPDGTSTTICSPGESVRTSTSNQVNWLINSGWFFDLPTAGERATNDPALGLGTLLLTSIRPKLASASVCGDSTTPDSSASYLYMLDYLTGGAVTGTSVIGVSLGSGLATRPVMVKFDDGSVRALIRTSGGSGTGTDQGNSIVRTVPVAPSTLAPLRRVSWRVLNGE